jgi:sugar phosphate isomerase/epimerase
VRRISRRAVLGSSAGAALWATLGCGDNAAPVPTYGGFSMSIQSWTFRVFDFEGALGFVDELGLAYVEMYEAHVSLAGSPQELAAQRGRLDQLGIRLLTHGTNPLSADHDANRAVFEFARAMGLRNLLADPPAEALDSLEQLVAEYDVRIAIHNHGPGSRYSVPEDVLAALAGRDARIGTCVDTGHYLRSGVDPAVAIAAFSGRLYGVHLKDVAAQTPTAPDVILGDGVLDVAGVFRALRDVGLPADAALSLEYEANPEAPLEDVRVSLAVADAAARATV